MLFFGEHWSWGMKREVGMLERNYGWKEIMAGKKT